MFVYLVVHFYAATVMCLASLRVSNQGEEWQIPPMGICVLVRLGPCNNFVINCMVLRIVASCL